MRAVKEARGSNLYLVDGIQKVAHKRFLDIGVSDTQEAGDFFFWCEVSDVMCYGY